MSGRVLIGAALLACLAGCDPHGPRAATPSTSAAPARVTFDDLAPLHELCAELMARHGCETSFEADGTPRSSCVCTPNRRPAPAGADDRAELALEGYVEARPIALTWVAREEAGRWRLIGPAPR